MRNQSRYATGVFCPHFIYICTPVYYSPGGVCGLEGRATKNKKDNEWQKELKASKLLQWKSCFQYRIFPRHYKNLERPTLNKQRFGRIVHVMTFRDVEKWSSHEKQKEIDCLKLFHTLNQSLTFYVKNVQSQYAHIETVFASSVVMFFLFITWNSPMRFWQTLVDFFLWTAPGSFRKLQDHKKPSKAEILRTNVFRILSNFRRPLNVQHTRAYELRKILINYNKPGKNLTL